MRGLRRHPGPEHFLAWSASSLCSTSAAASHSANGKACSKQRIKSFITYFNETNAKPFYCTMGGKPLTVWVRQPSWSFGGGTKRLASIRVL